MNVVEVFAPWVGLGFGSTGQKIAQSLYGFLGVVPQVLDLKPSIKSEGHGSSLPFGIDRPHSLIRRWGPRSFTRNAFCCFVSQVQGPPPGASLTCAAFLVPASAFPVLDGVSQNWSLAHIRNFLFAAAGMGDKVT